MSFFATTEYAVVIFRKLPRLEHFLIVIFLTYITWKLFNANGGWRWHKLQIKLNPSRKIANVPKFRLFRFPVNIPFIDGLITLYRLRRDGVRVMEEWASQFGRFYEGSFGTVKVYTITDPKIVQKVLQSSNPLHLNKPQYIVGILFAEWVRDGILNSDYNLWHGRRKMVARSLTYKSLLSFMKCINDHSRNLAKDLLRKCSKDERQVSGDIVWSSISFHAVKIIGEIAMGADKFSNEETSNFYNGFERLKRIVTERMLNPQLLIPPYWHFHPLKKEYTRHRNNCKKFLDKMVETYRKEFEQRKSTSQSETKPGTDIENDVGEKPFRCLMEEMLECGATNEEMCSEFSTFIMAGHETVATTLQFVLVHLALNPLHLKKCQMEVDTLMESKSINNLKDINQSSDAEIILNMDDLSSLEYLKRCIMEAMRLSPAGPVFVRRLDGPLEINENLTLPTNSTVCMSPWVTHRDPEYFSEPENFDPDRFLPEKIKERHPYAYIPFSAGPRNCIGYKLAMIEMKTVLAWILYNFDVYTTDKLEDVKLLFEITLRPERNYNVILKTRRQ